MQIRRRRRSLALSGCPQGGSGEEGGYVVSCLLGDALSLSRLPQPLLLRREGGRNSTIGVMIGGGIVHENPEEMGISPVYS